MSTWLAILFNVYRFCFVKNKNLLIYLAFFPIRELLVGGQEVACLLLGSLVAGYLRDNASVDGISQKLRQLCPTLYRQEDATCSKVSIN